MGTGVYRLSNRAHEVAVLDKNISGAELPILDPEGHMGTQPPVSTVLYWCPPCAAPEPSDLHLPGSHLFAPHNLHMQPAWPQ